MRLGLLVAQELLDIDDLALSDGDVGSSADNDGVSAVGRAGSMVHGIWLHYSRGWYYLFSVTALPCARYTNYLFRTRDFDTWEVGYYNPILSPCAQDRRISPYSVLTDDQKEQIRTMFLASSSDIDLCDWPEENKVLISYNLGNQLGDYYMAEAECEGSLADFLENNFR